MKEFEITEVLILFKENFNQMVAGNGKDLQINSSSDTPLDELFGNAWVSQGLSEDVQPDWNIIYTCYEI